jgi:hypothetical protein
VIIAETFHEYIGHLPAHEHYLFADLQLLYSPYEILQLINLRPLTIHDALFPPTTDTDVANPRPSTAPILPTWKLLLVSDGSEVARHMTFGWALCLPDGTVLVDHVDYFFLPDLRETIRTSTLQFLRNWIRLYEPSIMESIRVARSESVKNTHSLREHFRILPSQRPPKPRFDTPM